MHGKPYHTMPVSSWMVPGGNRDQKRKLMQEKKYPMKSSIQKNLGGPLSEVFFSSLTPLQQDHIGYSPKLIGPGRDLWVSPSDNLIGKVILKPPCNTRIRQALTHQGILELGSEIEDKVIRAHMLETERLLMEKEEEMMKKVEKMIKEAVDTDRQFQNVIHDRRLKTAQKNLTTAYQTILHTTIDDLLKQSIRRMEEAVKSTRRQLERELCLAVESHTDYLGRQYELQLAWRENLLTEKYENILKKQGQRCTDEMEKIQNAYRFDMRRSVAHIQAEHVTDLVVQACEKSHKHHEEKKHLEHNFGAWFVNNFENEIVNRDFIILELEDTIRQLEQKSQRREDQLRDIFRHFQKFINFALKETPGQAEFLLSLQNELRALEPKAKEEGEIEFIAKMIIDYILKFISENNKNSIPVGNKEKKNEEFTEENFRDKISDERDHDRLLELVGEELPQEPEDQEEFEKKQLKSLVSMIQRRPSVIRMFKSLVSLPFEQLKQLNESNSKGSNSVE